MLSQSVQLNAQQQVGTNSDLQQKAQQMTSEIQHIQGELLQWQQNGTSGRGQPMNKPMYESKSIANLKVLASDKTGFKNWNEKLINATTQSLGPEWRKFMRALNERLDLDRKVLTNV